MSIQYGPGDIRVDPDDVRFSHAGKTLLFKVRDFGPGNQVLLVCLASGSATSNVAVLFNFDDMLTPEVALKQHGSMTQFVKAKVVPQLQDWVNGVWKAGTAPVPSPAPVPGLELLIAALKNLTFTPQPDGTVKVS